MDQEFIYSYEEKTYPVKVTYKRIKNIHYRFDGESFIVSAPRRISNSFIKSGLDKYAKKLISRSVKVNAEGDDYLYLLGEKVNLSYPGEIQFSNGQTISYKDSGDLHKKLKKWFLIYLKERTEYYTKMMHAPNYLVKLRQMPLPIPARFRFTPPLPMYSITPSTQPTASVCGMPATSTAV